MNSDLKIGNEHFDLGIHSMALGETLTGCMSMGIAELDGKILGVWSTPFLPGFTTTPLTRAGAYAEVVPLGLLAPWLTFKSDVALAKRILNAGYQLAPSLTAELLITVHTADHLSIADLHEGVISRPNSNKVMPWISSLSSELLETLLKKTPPRSPARNSLNGLVEYQNLLNNFARIRDIYDPFSPHAKLSCAPSNCGYDARIVVDGASAIMEIEIRDNLSKGNCRDRLVPVLQLLRNQNWPMVEQEFFLHLADSYEESGGSTKNRSEFAFCCRTGEKVELIPDIYSINFAHKIARDNSFLTPRENAWESFQGRIPQVFWRGSLTGSLGTGGRRDILLNNRINFVLNSASMPEAIDAAITGIPEQSCFAKNDVEALLHHVGGVYGPVKEQDFWRFQAYIDLDGNSSAWGTIMKMWAGVLVLKPSSPYRVLWHDLAHSFGCFLEVPDGPESIANLFLETSVADRFEIAYRGHVVAGVYLKSILTGEWNDSALLRKRVMKILKATQE